RTAAALGADGRPLVSTMRSRMEAIGSFAPAQKPRVVIIEWIEPLMVAGNWMPTLVEMAGAIDALGTAGQHSAWITWDDLVRSDERYGVVGLVTTINASADRVAMHAVRTELLRAQARAARLPLWELAIPSPCSNEQYESVLRAAIARAEEEAIDCFAFGDLFLEDIRAYREKQLAATKLTPIFPLWARDTRELAREMIAGGLRARITCVDPRALSASFAGREF